jgi:hypothetical protein
LLIHHHYTFHIRVEGIPDPLIFAFLAQVTSALVDGSDVTLQVSQAVADLQSQRWQAAGTDLITLSNYLNSNVCHSVPCQVVDGLLLAAGTALQVRVACLLISLLHDP